MIYPIGRDVSELPYDSHLGKTRPANQHISNSEMKGNKAADKNLFLSLQQKLVHSIQNSDHHPETKEEECG